MWGFAKNPGNFQMPGPILCVTEDVPVTINLTNNLSEPVSMVFPGQTGLSAPALPANGLLAPEAAPGGTVSYTFTPSEPGTYLYESGTNPHKQVEMGLYGALIVRPAMGANFAYNDAATAFDPAREYLLLMHDIDPYSAPSRRAKPAVRHHDETRPLLDDQRPLVPGHDRRRRGGLPAEPALRSARTGAARVRDKLTSRHSSAWRMPG